MSEFNAGSATPIRVAVVNEATTPAGVDLAALVAALQTQVNTDAGPAWGLSPVTVTLEAAIPAGAWGLVLLDDADQADALGYHTVSDDGLPIGKVFVRTTLGDGGQVSVTTSHELLEMLVDPGVQLCAEDNQGHVYGLEVCDAVEAQTYVVGGVNVSDFLYPAWFESFHPAGSTKFNHLGNVQEPFQLTAGGYVSYARVGGFSQQFGSMEAQAKFNPARKHRAVRRGKPVGERMCK
jgi:hypothetical protein